MIVFGMTGFEPNLAFYRVCPDLSAEFQKTQKLETIIKQKVIMSKP